MHTPAFPASRPPPPPSARAAPRSRALPRSFTRSLRQYREFHDETYDGIGARVIQHEYDHLDGVLYIDLLSPLKRKLLKGRLSNITKMKVDVPYKMKVVK